MFFCAHNQMLNKSRKLVLRTFYHLFVKHVVLCISADVVLAELFYESWKLTSQFQDLKISKLFWFQFFIYFFQFDFLERIWLGDTFMIILHVLELSICTTLQSERLKIEASSTCNETLWCSNNFRKTLLCHAY